jgi:hypothetical protein
MYLGSKGNPYLLTELIFLKMHKPATVKDITRRCVVTST